MINASGVPVTRLRMRLALDEHVVLDAPVTREGIYPWAFGGFLLADKHQVQTEVCGAGAKSRLTGAVWLFTPRFSGLVVGIAFQSAAGMA